MAGICSCWCCKEILTRKQIEEQIHLLTETNRLKLAADEPLIKSICGADFYSGSVDGRSRLLWYRKNDAENNWAASHARIPCAACHKRIAEAA